MNNQQQVHGRCYNLGCMTEMQRKFAHAHEHSVSEKRTNTHAHTWPAYPMGSPGYSPGPRAQRGPALSGQATKKNKGKENETKKEDIGKNKEINRTNKEQKTEQKTEE